MSYMLLTLILVSLHYQNTLPAKVGLSCVADGENGVCELLKNCARATQDLDYDDKLYTMCTPKKYIDLDPIVCCLPNKEREMEETISEEWQKLPVSERKCLEYDRKVYKNFATTLEIGATPISRHRCKSSITAVVAGGTEADEKEFPYMVQLGYASGYTKTKDDGQEQLEYTWECGGTLISDLYVLTAAHCNKEKPIILAHLGALKMQDRKTIRGAKAVLYDNKTDSKYTYDPDRLANDILLVKLNESVSFNEYIVPACLPSAKFDIGKVFIAAGWGTTNAGDSQSNHLLKVELNEIENCKRLKQLNVKTQICAGSENEFKNTCRGDSGGPLVIRHEDKNKTPCMYTIVGIVSYGKICYQSTATQSAYTRVSAYVKWIECKVWDVGCHLL